MSVKADYTREELIEICERSVVPVGQWNSRDYPHSRERIGLAWLLLKSGCAFKLLVEGSLVTDDTIWFYIQWPGFDTLGETKYLNNELFYLPTPERLDRANGRDWYRT